MTTRTQTLAAICATCPHHVHSDERPDNLPPKQRMALCEVAGRGGRVPIPARLTMGLCPVDKFPRPELATLAGGVVKQSCGCGSKEGPHKPERTGRMIVMWPRWAERRVMWTQDIHTMRPLARPVWAPAAEGVAWYGVPMPLRWWIMLRFGIVQSYPGCGCVVAIKKLAPWLDGPLGQLERLRLAVLAPLCVWWHARTVMVPTPTGSVRVENPAWRPLPRAWLGKDGKGAAAAWVLAGLMVLAVLCLARAVV